MNVVCAPSSGGANKAIVTTDLTGMKKNKLQKKKKKFLKNYFIFVFVFERKFENLKN